MPEDWERLFHKHELEKQTRFHTKFIRADWVPERQVYVSQFEDVKDPSKKFTFESEVLVSAIGGFSTPLDKPQGMTGIETFKGECFHSARWRYDVDLKGKRVGVIGNGCSAGKSCRLARLDLYTLTRSLVSHSPIRAQNQRGAYEPDRKLRAFQASRTERTGRVLLYADLFGGW